MAAGLENKVTNTGGRDPAELQRGSRDEVEDDYELDAEGEDHGGEYEEDGADNSSSDREDGESDEGDEDRDVDADDEEDEDGESRVQPDDSKHKVKVAGEEVEVTLKELKEGYSRTQDYQQKTQKVAAERKQLTEGHRKVAQQYVKGMQATEGVIGKVLDVLAGSVNSAEMQQLRTANPAAWTTERLAIQDKRDAIQQILTEAKAEQERTLQAGSQVDLQDQQALVASVREEMQSFVPDWLTKDEKGVSGSQRLLQHLVTERGFTEQEVRAVLDPRMLKIAEEARLYRELKAGTEEAKARKKVKPKGSAPRAPQKSGSSGTGKQTTRSRNYAAAKAQAAKSGKARDAGNAINLLLAQDTGPRKRRRR